MGGSVLAAAPDSVHSTCIELQLLKPQLRLRLGGGVGGLVLLAAPGSVHITFIELLMPQHHTGLRSGFRLGLVDHATYTLALVVTLKYSIN